jgi:hypothetical protein
MNRRLPAIAFALVTAASGTALAREPCDAQHAPAGYGYGYPQGPAPAGYQRPGYGASIEAGLRYSDLDRNGWVTLDEALTHGRFEFQRADRNGDRVLSRHEIGRDGGRWGGHRGHRGHRDGRITRFEYQDAVREQFARLDVNRDGILAHYELGLPPPRPSRSAGWWPYR